jgi:hypothetical protein
VMDTFLGESFDYWFELKKRFDDLPDSLTIDHLLHELITANAKVRYYEVQIGRMNAYREAANWEIRP